MWSLAFFVRQLSGRCTRRCRCGRRKEKSLEERPDRHGEPGRAIGRSAGGCSSAFRRRSAGSLEAGSLVSYPTESRQVAGEAPRGWECLRPEFVIGATRPATRVDVSALIIPEAGAAVLEALVSNLPVEFQFQLQWQLGYSTKVDGISLRTLYRNLESAGPCLLVLEDSQNNVFGAFVSTGLKQQNRNDMASGSFLFKATRAAMPQTEFFHWAQACQSQAVAGASIRSAAFCDLTGIVIGIDGPGLFIGQDLLSGGSRPSVGFGSPCLTASDSEFVIQNVEVWHWKTPK